MAGMEPDVEKELRKIRKKLRQITRLQEKPGELTPEECRKVLAQHALRAQLKELMASSSSSTAPSLSVSSARLRAGRDGNVADISDAPVDSSFSDFDSSVASIGSSVVDDTESATLQPVSSPPSLVASAAKQQVIAQHDIASDASQPVSVSEKTASEDAAPAASAKGRITPPPIKLVVTGSSPPATSSSASVKSSAPADTANTATSASSRTSSVQPSSSRAADASRSKPTAQQQESEAFRMASQLPVHRRAWQSCHLNVKHLGDSSESNNLGLTCADCDGDLLVTGSRFTTVKVWDIPSASERRTMTGHTDTVTCVLLLPVGAALPEANGNADTDRYVVSSSWDSTVRVWNAMSGQQLCHVYTFSPVRCMVCTSDLIVTGGDSGRVQLWSWPSLQELCSIRVHEEALTSVHMQNRLLICGDVLGMVRLWQVSEDYRSARPLPSMDCVRGSPMRPGDDNNKRGAQSTSAYRPVLSLCLPNQQYLAWGDDGVNLKTLDLQTASVHKMRNHLGQYGRTECIALSASKNLLLSSAYDFDQGESYINIRGAASPQYLTTLSATDSDNASLGHVRSIACSRVPGSPISTSTNMSPLAEQYRFCCAGDSLIVFDVMPPPPQKAGKKASQKANASSSAPTGEFHCHFHQSMSSKAEDSDNESSDEEDLMAEEGGHNDEHSYSSDADNEDDFSPMAASSPRQRRRRKRANDLLQDGSREATAKGWWFMRWCTIL